MPDADPVGRGRPQDWSGHDLAPAARPWFDPAVPGAPVGRVARNAVGAEAHAAVGTACGDQPKPPNVIGPQGRDGGGRHRSAGRDPPGRDLTRRRTEERPCRIDLALLMRRGSAPTSSRGGSPALEHALIRAGVRSRRRRTLPKVSGLVTTLVLGGARSGKSVHAERLVIGSGLRAVYVATATAGDDEMSDRIARHRGRRGPAWTTIEEPLDLAPALRREAGAGRAVLVDCLTLWLSNLMHDGRDPDRETATLCETLAALPGPAVLVSNEVGLGLVPDTPLGRRFRDAQGRLNQAVAAIAPSVIFVAAGLPLSLKPPPQAPA